jgi:hypothetical protein
MNSETEEHFVGLIEKYGLDIMARDYTQEVFKKILDYTSMAIANPRQILLGNDDHLADLVADCNLVPIGSFALETLRNDKTILDALITFKEKEDNLSSCEFLELYKTSLEDCVSCEKTSNMLTIEFDFKIIQKNELETYLEVTSDQTKPNGIKMRIYVANISQFEREKSPRLFATKYDFSIVHLKRIYDLFEDQPDDLRELRMLLTVFRIWRDRCELSFLKTEIIDIILLNEFLNLGKIEIAACAINALMVLNHKENTRFVLSRFDDYYINSYDCLSDEHKSKILTSVETTLSKIFSEDISESKFI